MDKSQANTARASNLDIEHKLQQFSEMKNPFPYSLVRVFPFLSLLWLMFDVALNGGTIVRDYFRLSWYLSAIVTMLLINFLLQKNKSLLIELHNRHILKTPNIGDRGKFKKYLSDYTYWLCNKNYGYSVGVLFMVGIIVPTYPVVYWLTVGVNPWPSLYQWIYYYFLGIFAFVDVLIAFPVGLAFWQFGVMAWFLHRLGSEFVLDVQFSNPDNCGGLRSIGNLCLYNSIVILVPSLIISGWIVASNTPNYQGLLLWAPYLKIMLLILMVLSALVFFRPLLSTHRQMKVQRKEFLQGTENISILIEKRSQRFHNKIRSMSAEEISKEIEALNKLKAEYLSNLKAPSWPFDRFIFIRFVSAIFIPLLTPLGITDFVLKIISSVLGFARP